MNLKTCLLSLLLLLAVAAHAQDKIYKKDGSIIEARVERVTADQVIYTSLENRFGPEHRLYKSELIKIIYQNGATDVFNESGHYGKYKRHGKAPGAAEVVRPYGRNIISVIPCAYTYDEDGTMHDPGIGLSGERMLDRMEHISIAISAVMSFKPNSDFTGNAYQYGYRAGVQGTEKYTAITLMPGIRYYPMSRDNVVRYSLGGSFFLISGNEPRNTYDPTSGSYGVTDAGYSMYGFMVSNSVNISASRHLYLGVDLNAGITFSDSRRVVYVNDGGGPVPPPVMQLVLKIGYRY